MPPADHVVTLVTRVGCHLCDDARRELAGLAADLGVSWEEVDVDSDPELSAEYGDLVPVILVDGEEHGYFRVEPDRLRTSLLA